MPRSSAPHAITLEPTDLHVTIAGYVNPAFRADFERSVEAMERAGLRVDLRTHNHSELEGLHVPFEAQTTFYETFLARPGADFGPVFVAIAARLGFSPTARG